MKQRNYPVAIGIFAGLLTFGACLNARADTGSFTWIQDTPIITERVTQGGPDHAVVGNFLNWTGPDGELTSAFVPDGAVGYVLTEDGVSFTFDTTISDDDEEEQPDARRPQPDRPVLSARIPEFVE